MSQNEKSPGASGDEGLSRRKVMTALGIGAAASLAGLVTPAQAQVTTTRPSDVDILNFALNLEYLEAEFYLFATRGTGLVAGDTTGKGNTGATTGGSKITFTDTELRFIAEEIADDEQAHVRFLRAALGAQAIAKPAIKLDAAGFGFADEPEFLGLSRIFEDVGVSAYSGAAPLIQNKEVLFAAGRILATEAYHSGIIRLKFVQFGLTEPPVDGKDQPPSRRNFVPVDKDARAISRSVAEVLPLVRPFFPNGLNGAIV